MKLPNKYIIHVQCKHSKEDRDKLEELYTDNSTAIQERNAKKRLAWERNGSKGLCPQLAHNSISICYRARIVVSLPYLLEFVKQHMRLTEYEMIAHGYGLKNGLPDPYAKHIRDIAQSGLLKWLQAFLKGPVEKEIYQDRDRVLRLTPIGISSTFASVIHCFNLVSIVYTICIIGADL
jgi:hypothetical protein